MLNAGAERKISNVPAKITSRRERIIVVEVTDKSRKEKDRVRCARKTQQGLGKGRGPIRRCLDY